jgi:hypothetical protein
MASHQLVNFAKFAKEKLFFFTAAVCEGKLFFFTACQHFLKTLSCSPGRGCGKKKSVIVAWVLEFIRLLIVLFRCTRNAQGQFDGDPLVDKMEECSAQC